MMDPPVDSIDDKVDLVAQLIGQPLADDPAGHRDRGGIAMEEDAFRATRLTPYSEGTMDGFDDVAAFTELPQGRFELIGETPNAGLDLPGQPEALQYLQSPDA